MIKTWTCAAVLPLLVLATPAEAQDRDTRLLDAIVEARAVERGHAAGRLRDVNEMEVRTFKLVHLDWHDAESIVEPYVVAPGITSGTGGALTVREMPDVLDQIGAALKAIDVPPATPQFQFQLVKANGSARTDPRIADIEEALRRALRFDGYSLAGEAIASGTQFTIRVATGGSGEYEIDAMYDASTLGVELKSHQPTSGNADAAYLLTRVGIRPGQTLVLGSTSDAGETLLFVVRMLEG